MKIEDSLAVEDIISIIDTINFGKVATVLNAYRDGKITDSEFAYKTLESAIIREMKDAGYSLYKP